MATVRQSRVRSGFDAEVLLGERYLQMVMATALDGGTIPGEAVFGSTAIVLAMVPREARMHDAQPDSDGNPRPEHPDAFKTEILFGHPLGANVRVRAMIGRKNLPALIDFDLFVALELVKVQDDDGALAQVGMTLRVVGIASSLLGFILGQAELTEEELLAKVQAAVDRTIDLGGASKFKRVEDVAVAWHEPIDDHPACLGLYMNVRMRNGDPDEDFLPTRGSVQQARNFLPAGQDIAMASRPGMYADMAKHVYCSTAVETAAGTFDHAFRKSLLNPDSERIGDLNGVDVAMGMPGSLRIVIDGEVTDPTDLTNTDVTMTISMRPLLADDGSLAWDTDFSVDVDAVFEFTTIWAATFLFILFGPYAALILLGAVFLAELGVGIGVGLYKEGSVQRKADATLADVIPDRLTIATRRWDPFYATLHQVVTKPSQATFNTKGFLMCGTAFVGRELVPPVDTYIVDELRDGDGAVSGMRYFIADFEKVLEDSVALAPGTSRRSFSPATADEPSVWPLTLAEFDERLHDPEGPLVLANIPYFQAYVYIREHQIAQTLCLSGTEVEALQGRIRSEARQRGYDRIVAQQGDTLREEVVAELGDGATEDEIAAAVEARIQKQLKRIMDKYHSPSALRLARDGSMEPLLRFDLAPEELVMLQDKKVLSLDDGQLKLIRGRRVSSHTRDIPHHGAEEEDDDNLLSRPRYKPTPAGPVFR